MIKTGKLDFKFVTNLKNVYKPEFANDAEVRKAWYYFGFYFLPLVNKDWKENLHISRLRKKSMICEHVTTSDEAIVQWFLELWEPKIKYEYENNWPPIKKSYGEGDQELKARQNEYIFIHQNLNQSKWVNGGEFASQWNDIFWEMVEVNNPSAFKDIVPVLKQEEKKMENGEKTVPLPGIDDNAMFPILLKKRKLSELYTHKTENKNLDNNNQSESMMAIQSSAFITNKSDFNKILNAETIDKQRLNSFSCEITGRNYMNNDNTISDAFDYNSDSKTIYEM